MVGGIRMSDEVPIRREKKSRLIDITAMYEKGKNVPEIPETELLIGIKGGSDIDKNSKDLLYNRREYFVIGWVVPGCTFCTDDTIALPNPVWNVVFKVYSGKLNSGRLLNIEVYRCESYEGAGLSHGFVLVGRGQLSVPKKFRNDSEIRRCGLATPEGLPAGFLYIELMLKQLVLF